MKKILPLIIIMICIGQRSVFAYDLDYSPSLSLEITWTDNIEDEPIDTKKDYFFAATPRIVVNGKGERSTINLDGRVSGVVYTKFEEFNEISDYRLDSNFNYDPSKTVRFRLPASFIFSPSAESETDISVISGEEGVDLATEEIVRRADQYRFFAGPNIRYRFTERFFFMLTGRFQTTQYTEDIGGLTDSVTYSADTGLNYKLTRKTTGSINVSYSNNDFEVGNDSNIYASYLSVRHQYNKNLRLSASAGVSYISIDTLDSSFDYIGSVDGRLELKRALYRVNFDREVQTTSFGNTVTRDRVRGSFSIPLSRRTAFICEGRLSRSESSDGDEDRILKSVSFQIDYTPLKHLSFFISGSHEDQDERAVAGEDLRINRVTAGFTLWASFVGSSVNE